MKRSEVGIRAFVYGLLEFVNRLLNLIDVLLGLIIQRRLIDFLGTIEKIV
jgi:hypothetical protein